MAYSAENNSLSFIRASTAPRLSSAGILYPHWHEFVEVALYSHEISSVVALATLISLKSELNTYEIIAKR